MVRRALRPLVTTLRAPEVSVEAGRALDGLRPGWRVEVLEELAPGRGEGLARWWVDGQAQPYLAGRPWRAGASPGLTLTHRCAGLGPLLAGAEVPSADWDQVVADLRDGDRQRRLAACEAMAQAPAAVFDGLLVVVLELDLTRTAAVARVAAGWLGLDAPVPLIKRRLRRLVELRAGGAPAASAWDTYLGLVALAVDEVHAAMDAAVLGAAHGEPDVRAAVARFSREVGLRRGEDLLVRLLEDEDVRVAALAHRLLAGSDPVDASALAERLPARRKTVDPIGVESDPLVLARALLV